MNVGKVIRVLGYIVYTILWLPIIVLYIVGMPIVHAALSIRSGQPVKNSITIYKDSLANSIKHDANFIQTGEW